MLKHKRLVSIIATLAFCLSFLAPALLAPAPALAAGNIEALRVPTVSADTSAAALGTVRVTVPAGSIRSGETVVFSLPDDCEFVETPEVAGVGAAVYNYLSVPSQIGNNDNGLWDKAGTKSRLDIVKTTKDEIHLRAISGQDATNDGVFFIYLDQIKIGSVDPGDLTANFDGPATGFPLGNVVIAKTSDADGEVTLVASQTETKNDNFKFNLRIREDIKGAFTDKADSIVLTLPDGFGWTKFNTQTTKSGSATLTNVWGENVTVDYTINDDELAFTNQNKTTKASAWDINLEFEVIDDDVDMGDIVCKVSGKSNYTPKELKVGTYGDFGVELSCEKMPEVFAGKIDQEIGEFTIEEIIPNSLLDGRYITLELPSYAKWTSIDPTPRDSNVDLNYSSTAGSNGNVLKYTINDKNVTSASGKAKIDFESFKVALDVTAPGDLIVTVGGNAGIEGEIEVATIALPVTMTAENATEVKIGAAAQKIADLTITESVAEAIADDKELWLKVPAGCEWAKVPTITVESGDLKLDVDQARRMKAPAGAATTDYYQFIVIPVDRDSNEPSVIKVTDCYVTVDRTVPEGPMTVALLGGAVLESNTAWGQAWFDAVNASLTAKMKYRDPLDPNTATGYTVGSAGMFPQTQAIAGAAAATVVTPSGEQGRSASFYIGSTIMNVNGANIIMDAAPYIKAGRTYVPVRYLGDALGATTEWDAATKTVTVTKGDNTVVLVIGSTIAKVNGADVQMDVAPEITGVGRTMLPARWVAEGLGYQVGWNAALQQVVIQ